MTNKINISGFDENLRYRLKEDGIDAKSLINWLKYNKGIIAGSYILQIILGERWEGSDIDVYITHYNNTKPPNAEQLSNIVYKRKFYKNKDILGVTEWSIGKKSDPIILQIMHINSLIHHNLTNFIDQYDLDFCKVIFDGFKLNVMYPDSVKTRTSVYNRITDWNGRKEYRTQKYIKRGFKVIG